MAFARRKPADIGVKAPFPDFVEPALASPIERVPSRERWIHEIKFDGYRVQTHIHNDAVKIFTRRGHDWTRRFKKAAHDAWPLASVCALQRGVRSQGTLEVLLRGRSELTGSRSSGPAAPAMIKCLEHAV